MQELIDFNTSWKYQLTNQFATRILGMSDIVIIPSLGISNYFIQQFENMSIA
jgi:hypothetical protein